MTTFKPLRLFDGEEQRQRTLSVAETFGPTIQGEGRRIGTPAVFLRLGGCNLKCGINGGWKCDTPYTWLFSKTDAENYGASPYDPRRELRQESVASLYGWLLKINDTTQVRTLVVTGGEPLLQDEGLHALFNTIICNQPLRRWTFEVETNGTIIPTACGAFVSQFNVSPKLANSGNPKAARINPEALRWFGARSARRATFKFVCAHPRDLDEVDEIVKTADADPRAVYIMPEGVSPAAIAEHQQVLVSEVIRRGYNLTTRLHVQLWGNKRGV